MNDQTDWVEKMRLAEANSLRQDDLVQLAATAPDVPDWFEHRKPDGRPKRKDFDIPEFTEPEPVVATDWDGPQEYDRAAKARSEWATRYNKWHAENGEVREDRQLAYSEAVEAWDRADKMARLIQWRWAYATAMLAAMPEEVK